MNKKTFFNNIKYITFGLVVAVGLSFVHADFVAPTATAPSNGVDVPIHTGPSQVKDGDLSVGSFLANGNAAFEQETFLNGTVFGGSPTKPSATVTIGDSTAAANIVVNGNVSASAFITSRSVANTSSLNLCATTNGTIVTCGQASGPTTPPTLTEVTETDTGAGGIAKQVFTVGSSVVVGDTYTLGVYSHEVTVTAGAGEDASNIVQDLVAAINNTTAAQWNDHNAAPASGTPGFKPSAESDVKNPTWIILTLNYGNQFGSSTTGN